MFSTDVGLIVFEVKDWNLGQIVEADPQNFRLRIGAEIEQRQNPRKQARDYLDKIFDAVKKDGRLISKDPFYHGNPKIPIQCGIVFPNINKLEYKDKRLNRIIREKKIFF